MVGSVRYHRPDCSHHCPSAVEQIVARHGVPNELLSDRGKAFLSKLLHEVYGLKGMKKLNTTSYHPQMDGLVERFGRAVEEPSKVMKRIQRGRCPQGRGNVT